MSLIEELESLKNEAQAVIKESGNEQDLDNNKNLFIGKKGRLTSILKQLSSFSIEDKKKIGARANEISKEIESIVNSVRKEIKQKQIQDQIQSEFFDIFQPTLTKKMGSLHPITTIRQEIEDIFISMGFSVMDGPEVELDYNNFEALNFTQDHPARDMQDTFYIDYEKEILLRTHTSSAQIRVMEKQQPPIRIITPGRVFRNETISARAHCTFHQVEGLYIDKDVSFADLKQTLYYFAKEMFGSENIRMRPSYFPFTEPSAEIDVSCFICDQKGCPVCKQSGWVEIGGCGMVDPAVLENCNIDPNEYTGFAFGMGIERITMLKYGINDLRLFFENDVRFLEQFK